MKIELPKQKASKIRHRCNESGSVSVEKLRNWWNDKMEFCKIIFNQIILQIAEESAEKR